MIFGLEKNMIKGAKQSRLPAPFVFPLFAILVRITNIQNIKEDALFSFQSESGALHPALLPDSRHQKHQ